MIFFNPQSAAITDALLQWRGRSVLPTSLGSRELRQLGREVLERAVFSARTTHAGYLQDILDVVDAMLSGEINQATGRWTLMKRLAELGYDPATGFPDDDDAVPPAGEDTLQDLGSQARLDLILETNTRMAANYGRMVAGNDKYARYAFPAWELVRFYERMVPRGSEESRSEGWLRRWSDAGDSVQWVGAAHEKMIALKDSPIWQALADGAGGYQDTLGHPYPPYAFYSGMGWRAVPREEALALLGDTTRADYVPAATQAPLSPVTREVNEVFEGLSPELQEQIRRELGELGELRTPNSELRTPNSERRTPNMQLRTPKGEGATL